MDSQVFHMREASGLLETVITRHSSLLKHINQMNNKNPKDFENLIIHSSITEHNFLRKWFSTSRNKIQVLLSSFQLLLVLFERVLQPSY